MYKNQATLRNLNLFQFTVTLCGTRTREPPSGCCVEQHHRHSAITEPPAPKDGPLHNHFPSPFSLPKSHFLSYINPLPFYHGQTDKRKQAGPECLLCETGITTLLRLALNSCYACFSLEYYSVLSSRF